MSKHKDNNLPTLYVEGSDDISVINALMVRHGFPTDSGKKYLVIRAEGASVGSTGSDGELFAAMPDRIKNDPPFPCGFVFDIDIKVQDRWEHARNRIMSVLDGNINLTQPLPDSCETDGLPGYIGQIRGYAKPFGVWLMPDCRSDGQKLEHLIESLVPADDPILKHARECTSKLPALVKDTAFKCFAEKDRIKAEVRAWLAWQEEPGMQFGTAINKKILKDDSPQAMAFLGWLSRLYGFQFEVLKPNS
ncbi:MAG: DUF3226 domain-containing protein [Fimbriiglobus sp.]